MAGHRRRSCPGGARHRGTAGASISGPIGPSTVTAPYVLPVADGVSITSLLTVDDAGSARNGYEMVGIPDGLGAFAQGKKLVTFMNHELQATEGIVRAHGQRGAFVSRLEINPKTGEVLSGSDLIRPGVQYWDYLTSSYAVGSPTAPAHSLTVMCSAPTRRRSRASAPVT